MKLSFIDGLATFWPYGTGLYAQKNMSNLAVAWFDVFNQENHIPFMKKSLYNQKIQKKLVH